MVAWLLFVARLPFPRRAVLAGLSLAMVVLSLAPWTWYNYQRFGKFVPIDARAEKHLPVYTQSDASSNGTMQQAGASGRLQSIARSPGAFLARFTGEFIHFWSFVPDRVVTKEMAYREKVRKVDERMVTDHALTARWLDYVSIFTYGPVLVLAVIGLIAGWPAWRGLSLVLALLLSQALGYSFFFTQVRYRLPVEFCLMIFAGIGVELLINKHLRRT
jgi:hypothetical protein